MGSCCSSSRTNKKTDDDENGESNNGHMGVDYFQRDEIDVSKYVCQELSNVTVVKEAGELNGQAFHIESCDNCIIYLLDHTAAVTIDLCNDCQIFVGPCKGSVFVRESKRCHIMASCQQFRARDTVQSTFQLHCTTQPVIENCSSIKFCCFSGFYPQLKDHLTVAGLSPLNNNWYSVHDFTPQSGNWVTLKREENLPSFGSDQVSSTSFQSNCSSRVVPRTLGIKFQDEYTKTSVVVFLEDSEHTRALKFIENVKEKLSLLITKDTKMKTNGLQQFFLNNAAAPPDLRDGMQIEYLLLAGDQCIQICSQALQEDPMNTTLNSYCSPNESQAWTDYQKLSHLIDSGIMNS
ncbi:PREDICTED: protein XRP2-like [Amphimedon queenslandica]|uniref:Protein XRP2 n=1 Tax=Amphimedon queenslandica TaxID=400682 RepID=A0A1X7TY98_AMPQE|nr:PREDICTED: protein XRP2-like [Amphimedon queenslandica]|eukprot:XP_003389530.1 PREDICTED: protein XRP2-like [Amphimedon queenslandica]